MNVVILWHMHQPYYVNPLTKKAMMPWVRLHAAKGYLDMIDLVTAHPDVRVTFNFTPVLVRQIHELNDREVEDEWETLSAKPAANLNDDDRRRLVENFFKINWDTLVRPVPRYAELLAKRGASYTTAKVDAIAGSFTEADFRDLQLLYNLQWCGFSAFKRFPILGEIKAKGRDFTEDDKRAVLDVHRQILAMVLPEYRAGAGPRTDRADDHALFPSDHAAGLRHQHRATLPAQLAPALAVLRARRCAGPPAARAGAARKDLRPPRARALAVGGFHRAGNHSTHDRGGHRIFRLR